MKEQLRIADVYISTDYMVSTQCGKQREYKVSAIEVEFENGARFQLNDSTVPHFYVSNGNFVYHDDDAVYKRMQRVIDKIKSKVSIVGKDALDLTKWTETYPAYGSERYLSYRG